ncbi:sulfatase [Halococcus sp. IIIV-5B]|uniref:sulfatase family protein n=1 Tax=Halococcus sp. IIIV-5B TaxID=2321230 RepID=UPI000E75E717|nr:sulfatase [Halococcus sp. IIIV-5B]RJT00189.1 sulfatase [Halococcus sp. IIIV-5B]
MRIVYIDCDSLRPDHLGCYGYDRDTSPTIDALAADGMQFSNVHASDVPCLPSRTALFTGRFGVHTGVVNHGGLNASLRPRGAAREFNTAFDGYRTWMSTLRHAGFHTALFSLFPQRHGAWHVVDGFDEWHDTPGYRSDHVYPLVEEWLDANAESDDWYLHVNFWDPHTPYDTPSEYGNPFADDPAPEWLTEDVIEAQRGSYGTMSARETGDDDLERTPDELATREDFEQWIDGYDTGIRYMDDHIARIVRRLEDAGVREETLFVVSADHGENQGELNVYGDHQTADAVSARVPLVVSGPGVEAGHDDALRYQLDLPPTITEFAGGEVPQHWDGRSFASALTGGSDTGREFLVLSQGAWACQRGVRWDDWLLLRTHHDGLKDFAPVELYDLAADPHETTDLAREHTEVAREGLALLEQWRSTRLTESAMGTAGGNPDSPRALTDPLIEVIEEGGPYHPRDDVDLDEWVERLHAAGDDAHADKLATHEGVVPEDVDAYLDGEDVWARD